MRYQGLVLVFFTESASKRMFMLRPGSCFLVGLILLSSCTPAPSKCTSTEATRQNDNDQPMPSELPEVEVDPVRPGFVQAELNTIRKTLDTIALDLSCSMDTECVVLAADDNACGIPTEWLIFSVLSARYIEVEALLERSFYLDNTYPNSRVQVCGGPSEPKLICQDGQCKKAPLDP